MANFRLDGKWRRERRQLSPPLTKRGEKDYIHLNKINLKWYNITERKIEFSRGNLQQVWPAAWWGGIDECQLLLPEWSPPQSEGPFFPYLFLSTKQSHKQQHINYCARSIQLFSPLIPFPMVFLTFVHTYKDRIKAKLQ